MLTVDAGDEATEGYVDCCGIEDGGEEDKDRLDYIGANLVCGVVR